MQQISQEKQGLWGARKTADQKRGGGDGEGGEMSVWEARWERMDPASRGGETRDGKAESKGTVGMYRGLPNLVSVSVPQLCGDWILGRQN